MATTAEAFELAWKHRQAGQVLPAEGIDQQILQAHPNDAGSWCRFGDVCLKQGKLAEAAPHYRQALRIEPDSVEAHCGLGHALAAQGKRDEATASYRQALRINPDHAEARGSLGVALAEQGNLDEAIANLRQALRFRPDLVQAHHNLGIALAQQGKLDEAVRSLQQALQLKPDYAEAYGNLGNILAQQGQRQAAVENYQQALRLKPDYVDVYNNLGLALRELGKLGESVLILQQAVRLRPAFVEAHNNLGLALAEQGKFAEAEASYHEALHINPRAADVHTNLGSTYKEQGRLEEALASYQLALWHQPDSVCAHWNRSLAWLQMGNFEQGWPEYEWRWRRKETPPRPFRQPLWDGSPLAGRAILLHMEQGLGDMLHFIRYARLLKQRGGTVLVECPGFLIPLFSRCPDIDRLIAEGSPLPDFDVYVPLLSLPRLLGTTLATVPADVPYLFADKERIEQWRRRLSGYPGFKVGIVWQGNPHHGWDRYRSIPLVQFAHLARLEGVRLFSLQKVHGTEQLRALAGRFPVSELAEELDTEGAFTDTAAIMKNLDLVITPDTATAHLAGALGVPVWVALSAIVDWRWMFQREDSPWYPTMRLFRQTELGHWEPVFERMAAEAQKLLAARSRSIRVEVAPGELLDKITILEIKRERIADPEKLGHVRAELAALVQAREQALSRSEELATVTAELKGVNEALWQIEDEIRSCERTEEFGLRFTELARSVYRRNDERAALKRKINELLDAPFSEQKCYPSY